MHSKSLKCNKKSNEFLNESSELKSHSRFTGAILALNKALCFATSDDQIAIIFANRALIFYETRKYEKCLENVALAKARDYRGELLRLEDDCKQQLLSEKNQDECPWNYFKITHSVNEKIPFVASCLKLHESWKFGRSILTDKALNTGDIVVIEEPFFKTLNKDVRYKRCSNCLKSNLMSLLPCSYGCIRTMYCSEACMNLAWKRYHKHECASLEDALENNEYDLTIQRMTFESLSLCDGDINKLKTLVGDIKTNQSIYDYDISTKNDIEREKLRLKAIYALKKGISSEEDKHMANWLIEDDPTLKSCCKTKEQKDFLKTFILRIMGIVDRNCYLFYSMANQQAEKDEEIGSGIFSFASLLNHSCSPNLYRCFVDNKQVYIVKRPIRAGEQLFVGYLSNFTLWDREKRRANLYNDFQFKCSCEACVNNYPLMKELKRYDKDFKEPPLTNNYSISEIQNLYTTGCEYIDKNMKEKTYQFPSYEICYLMQFSFRLLHLLANKPFLID